MTRELTCIVCPKGCRLQVTGIGTESLKVEGNSCPRGMEYGIKEVTAPTRVLTSTVKFEGTVHKTLPVKTSKDIPKTLVWECMTLINRLTIKPPIKMGDVLIENLLGTGAQLVATRDQEK